MLSVESIIQRALSAGIEFIQDGDLLRLKIPREQGIDGQLLELIRENKEAIRSYLRRHALENTARMIPSFSRPGELVPLSFSQERLWFIDRLEGSVAYHIPWVFRVEGRLDIASLTASLRQVLERHAVLRSVILEHEGRGFQQVQPLGDWQPDYEDTLRVGNDGQAARVELDRWLQQPFHLSAEWPLRVRVMRLGEDKYLLAGVLHHIAGDGWSVGVLIKELTSGYQDQLAGRTSALPEPPIQYGDYALWQRDDVQQAVTVKQLDYWKKQLSGLETLELPVDHPRPAQATGRGGMVECRMDADLLRDLKQLSQRREATLFMTLLAAWKIVLWRYSGQRDIAIGTPVAGREYAELEELIGFFVNTVVLRSQLEGEWSFQRLLEKIKETTLSAYAHQQVSFEKVVEVVAASRDRSRTPLFQVMFVMQNTPATGTLELSGVRLFAEQPEVVAAKLDLALNVTEGKEGLLLQLEYRKDLFDRQRIVRMLEHYIRLLRAVVVMPDSPIAGLDMLGEEEKQQLVAWSQGPQAAYPLDRTVVELFRDQAMANPETVAVVYQQEQLSYGELDVLSNRLGHYLRRLEVREEDLVAVCMQRSLGMVPGILGILKAGAAYVPVDPAYPQDRIAYMLSDTGSRWVLTDRESRDRLPQLPGVRVVVWEEEWEAIAAEAATAPSTQLRADHLAYVIYTSGSTGRPKGVMVEHRGLVNLAYSQKEPLRLHPGIHVLQFASQSFDASCYELFCTLLAGGRLVLAQREQLMTTEGLQKLLTDHHIELATLPPSYQSAVAEDVLGLRTIVSAGEALGREQGEAFQARGIRVVNAYGPTENTVCATLSVSPLLDEGRVTIGRPIDNVRTYILDDAGRLSPEGVAGELYIGGVQVARGYWRRDDLTADRFVNDPFSEAGRLYRTGDRCRWLAGGNIEYLGRMDEQVKIRGYRIEPGEVENALSGAEGVKAAAVIVREGREGDKRLVGYVVMEASLDREAVLTHLRSRLPEYMVPAQLVQLEALPLTSSGKVDRKALPEPEITGGVDYLAPRDEMEKTVVAIWQQLLGIERVGIYDNFFFLGGHSLLAMRLAAAIRRRLDREVAVRDIFLHPTVAGQSLFLKADGGAVALPPLKRLEQTGPVPLSFTQERLWFIDRLEGSVAYHIPWVFRVEGRLDVEALTASLRQVLTRHEVLRSVIVEQDGRGYQQVQDLGDWQVDYESGRSVGRDGQAIRAELDRWLLQPFDLSAEWPLRVRVLRLGEDQYLLAGVLHHIAGDGWSLGILVKELASGYQDQLAGRTPALPELPVQYGDYAVWQREEAHQKALEVQLGYWKEQLSGLDVLELPTDRPRPAQASGKGGVVERQVDASMFRELKRLSERQGATLFMTLLAVWKIVLWRYSGQRDIAVGSPVAGRAYVELEELIGSFINTIVLRSRLEGEWSFEQLLAAVKEMTLSAYAHQQAPFERVVEAVGVSRDLGHTPLFQVLFVLQNTPDAGTLELSGVRLFEEAPRAVSSKFDLTLTVSEEVERLSFQLVYSLDLFEQQRMQQMLEHYIRLLQEVVAAPAIPIARLEMLGEEEQQQLLSWSQGSKVVYPPDRTVVELFLEQALLRPGAAAVVFEQQRLSYAGLEARSNQLGHYLRNLGVCEGSLVMVSAKRSLEVVVGIMGILKAGAAFIPVDPGYPAERIAYMLDDADCSIVLVDQELKRKLSPFAGSVRLVDLAEDWAHIETNYPADAEALDHSHPDGLVYTIYTSGSTGNPKGVMIEHRSLVDHVYGIIENAGLADCRSFAIITSLSADLIHSILFAGLVLGGEMHILSDELLPDGYLVSSYLSKHSIDCTKIVPSLWLSYWDGTTVPLPAKALLFGGEALSQRVVDILAGLSYKGITYNHYGPTEATIGTCIHKVDINKTYNNIPIGKPYSNTQVYITDDCRHLCPVGIPGELYIGGDGIARGYLNQPLLTEQKFIPDPFREGGAARLYRTGDKVRWTKEGTIEYIGRLDQQIKIRGYRIEPGEVESVLSGAPGVRAAAVVVREGREGDKRLVAYMVTEDAPDREKILAFLRSHLPEHMIPAQLVQLESLPLLLNGKLDKKRLPDVDPAPSTEDIQEPRTPYEAILLQIWKEVLGVEKIGVYSNFFEMGGDSIMTIQVVSRARKAGLSLQPRDLFVYQHVADLALRSAERKNATSQGEQGVLNGDCGLLPVQQRFFAMPGLNEESHYNQSILLHVSRNISVMEWQEVVHALVDYHDSLRFTYQKRSSGWTQEYSAAKVHLDIEDLRDAKEDAISGLIDAIGEHYQRSLSIEQERLAKFVLIRTPFSQEFDRLLIVIHHLAIDGVSWRILTEDIEAALSMLKNGRSISLGVKETSCRQWYHLLTKYAGSHRLQSQKKYWEEVVMQYGPLPADIDYAGSITRGDLDECMVHLDKQMTHLLLTGTGEAFHTDVNDLLLASVAGALTEWTGNDKIVIGMESHGRDGIPAGQDLSRTTGWFTAIYPMLLCVPQSGNEDELIKSIKEQCRNVPDKGLGFGVLKYLSGGTLAQTREPWDIIYNYLGQAGNIFRQNGYLVKAEEAPGPEAGSTFPIRHKLEISCMVAGDELVVKWLFSRKHFYRKTVEAVTQGFIDILQKLVLYCLEQKIYRHAFTPSDYGLSHNIGYKEWDRFIAKVENKTPGSCRVEGMCKLSSLQNGLLFHVLYNEGSGAYVEQLSMDLKGLDPDCFIKSWRHLFRKHSVLRSAFYLYEFAVPVQCVYAEVQLPLTTIVDQSEKGSHRAVGLQEFHLESAPLMRIELRHIEDDHYRMIWTYHHLILDGWSRFVIVREVLEAYRSFLAGTAPELGRVDNYSDYIRYQELKDKDQERRFWTGYMAGITSSSLLPFVPESVDKNRQVEGHREVVWNVHPDLTGRVNKLSKQLHVTVNTVMQGLWAYLLYRYTGNSAVVYGMTVSGRPGDLPDVENRVGMYINTLPARIFIREEEPIAAWLRSIQHEQQACGEFQYSSLADIQQWTGLPRDLFDTILIFQNFPVWKDLSHAEGLQVSNIREYERTSNYPLSVRITWGDEPDIRFMYKENVLDAGYVNNIRTYFEQVLVRMVDAEDLPLRHLEGGGENHSEKDTTDSEAMFDFESEFFRLDQ